MHRTLKLVVVMLLVSLLATACANKPGPAPTANTTEVERLRLGVMVGEAGSKTPTPDPVMDALIAAFQEQHPGIRVEKYPIDVVNEVAYKSMRMAIQEEKVDLLPAGWISSMVQEKLLEPLDPYLQKTQLDWKPLGDIEDLKVDGALYQMPYRVTPFIIRYNADLLEASGEKVPEGEWTWEQFRQLAKKLTVRSGDSTIWGFETPVPSYLLDLYLRQSTPDQKWRYNEAAMEAGLRLFSEMIFLDQSMPKLSDETDLNGRPVTDPAKGWAGGKAVMTLSSLNSAQTSGNPFKTGILPMPMVPGAKPFTFAPYSSLSMATTSTNKELAWEFLTFAAGPEGAAIIAKTGALPAYRTKETMDVWLGQNPTVAMRTIANAPSRLYSGEASWTDQSAKGAFEMAFIAAFGGEKPWEQVFTEWQKRLKGTR